LIAKGEGLLKFDLIRDRNNPLVLLCDGGVCVFRNAYFSLERFVGINLNKKTHDLNELHSLVFIGRSNVDRILSSFRV
jgi:hypothetical protein